MHVQCFLSVFSSSRGSEIFADSVITRMSWSGRLVPGQAPCIPGLSGGTGHLSLSTHHCRWPGCTQESQVSIQTLTAKPIDYYQNTTVVLKSSLCVCVAGDCGVWTCLPFLGFPVLAWSSSCWRRCYHSARSLLLAMTTAWGRREERGSRSTCKGKRREWAQIERNKETLFRKRKGPLRVTVVWQKGRSLSKERCWGNIWHKKRRGNKSDYCSSHHSLFSVATKPVWLSERKYTSAQVLTHSISMNHWQNPIRFERVKKTKVWNKHLLPEVCWIIWHCHLSAHLEFKSKCMQCHVCLKQNTFCLHFW